MKWNNLLLIYLLILPFQLIAQAHFAIPRSASIKLLGDFKPGWEKHWIKRKFNPDTTSYRVDKEGDDLVLMIETIDSDLSLWRPVNIPSIRYGKIKWRWKVERSLTENKQERKKIGDDYAARLFVVFEPHLVNWQTRAICYVWAGNEPVGSIYRNPYARSVAMVVVESGNKRAGEWIREERNFVNDYYQIFGRFPEMVSAVVIMVDTNNIRTSVAAWFDDVLLEYLISDNLINSRTNIFRLF